jgi:predicted permease
VTWLRRLMNRGKMEQQLEKELRFHLDQHTNDLIAQGYSPDEARRQARLAVGGPEQVKEECRDARGTRWLEDLLQDIRYALRTLRQRPGFSVVALLTLAIGIGATTAMFTVLYGVLLKPLAYPDPQRLVALHTRVEKFGDMWNFSNPDFQDFRDQTRSLAVAAWTYTGATMSEPGEAEYVEARQVSAELFSVLGIQVSLGRSFLPSEDQRGAAPVAIISDSLWRRRYEGKPSAIGGRLVYDGTSYTIVGIAGPGFRLDGEADVLTPLGQNTDIRARNRLARFIRVVGRLQPGATLAGARTELSLIAANLARQYTQSNAGVDVVPHPLQEELAGDVGATLWLLLGAVSLVLLIACANVASLQLARAVSREREVGLRMALGAGRGRLLRQCLTEGAILGVFGGALGVLLALAAVRPFILLWPGTLPRASEIGLDGHVLLFALAAALLSGLLFGLAPALRTPAQGLEQTLRAGSRTLAGSSRRLHSGFVISEIALAVVLLISAGILGRVLLRLSSLDPGLNIHNVLTARLAISPGALTSPAQARAAWNDLLDHTSRVPGVKAAALADIIPMRPGENVLGYWATAVPPPPNQAPVALASGVTPDYIDVTGIPLLHGRFLNHNDKLDSPLVVVIDESMARHAFGDTDVVGRHLWVPAISRDPILVVGVVGHVRHWGLAADDSSKVHDQCYYPLAQVPDPLIRFFSSILSVAVRTEVPPLNVLESLRRELRGATGDQSLYGVRTMEQLVSASLARQRFLLLLFGIFAGVALLLACIGIYGVLAYLTGQRVPEIGVRIALGASATEVMWMVLRQSLQMILAGVAVGATAGLVAARLLKGSVDGVHSIEPRTFVVMISVLLVAALCASFVPAWRASQLNPMTALRQQ